MKILPFMKSLVTSPARSIRKREVKKDIINTSQSNKGVANIYRKNPNNAGEAKREEDGKACPGEAVGN